MKNLIKSLFLILIYGSLVFGAVVGVKALYEKINYQFCEKCDYIETVTLEPTCISTGEKTKTCKVCGHFETETINALEHVYSESKIVQPTCDKYGTKTYECESCHVIYIEEIEPIGHLLLDPSHAELIYTAKDCSERNVYKLSCLNEGCDYFTEYYGNYGECSYTLNYSQDTHYQECSSCHERVNLESHTLSNEKVLQHKAKNCQDETIYWIPCIYNCGYYEVVKYNDGECIFDDTFAPEKWMCIHCFYETSDVEEVNKLFGLYINTRYVGTTDPEMVTTKCTVKTGNLYFIYVTFDKVWGKIELIYDGELITKDNATWNNETNLFFDTSINNYTLMNDRTGSYCITYDFVNNVVTVMYD